MIIKIGTLVLCHLMAPNQLNTENEMRKINQTSGIVKEIIEEENIEMVDDSYAVKKKKHFLIVEPKEKDKIFKIGSDACRPVLSEEEHLSIVREKIRQKESLKKEQIKENKKTKKQQVSDPEIQDLLQQLEK